MIKKEHWQWIADYESGVRGSPIPAHFKEDHLDLNRNTSMNINQLSESKYMKKEDCIPPIVVTISGLTNENMAKDGEPPENKYVLQFSENVKPLVLNITNGQLIAHVTGSEETNDWVGHKITLYNDPSVSFGGKLTGGVRVQIPQQTGQAPDQFSDDEKLGF